MTLRIDLWRRISFSNASTFVRISFSERDGISLSKKPHRAWSKAHSEKDFNAMLYAALRYAICWLRQVYQINFEDTKAITGFPGLLFRFSSIPLDHKERCFSIKGPMDFLD